MLRALPFLALFAWPCLANDWPQFRGPDRSGASAEKGLLQAWPKDGPKLLWTIDTLGQGYSAPSIVGNKIYVLGSDEKNELLFCLDASNGGKLWATPIGPLYENPWGGGPRGSATVEGGQVFALGGQGVLLAADAATGKKQWSVDLTKDLGAKHKKYPYPNWGFSESPLVDATRIYLTPGGDRGTMAGLDRKTGKTLWRSVGWTDEIDYASPVKHTFDGTEMIVQLTGAHVAGVSPRDGAILWKYPRAARITISSPICQGDRVFVASDYGVGCDEVELAKKNGKFVARGVYGDDAKKAMLNHHGGVVLHAGHLYGHSTKGGWTCMEFKTGKVAWNSRKTPKGSLVYADGRFVLFDEEKGGVVLIEATPAAYKEHGRFVIPAKSKLKRPARRLSKNFWTHPVIANGRLYLRDQEQFMVFDIKAK